ncbi:hypothetical protein BJ170DRAFT_685855 [Xylariales sp. AK1849]|nr:hypothetical protein BJ170DRAFT_685855 [Xylariales sp. AK1849]
MSPYFEIRNTPSKGTGVFAICDIPAGTAILQEEAFLLSPNCKRLVTHPTGTGAAIWLPHPPMCSAIMTAFDALDAKVKQSVLDLHAYRAVGKDFWLRETVDAIMAKRKQNASSREDYVKLLFVVDTNSFASNGGPGPMSELYLLVSRFNHSCVYNAHHAGGPTSSGRELVVRARTDIKKGEEITLTYIDPWMANRQARLKGIWGFECLCSVCDINDTAMDTATRSKYEEAFEQVRTHDKALFEGQT